jgi:hypothetical protein
MLLQKAAAIGLIVIGTIGLCINGYMLFTEEPNQTEHRISVSTEYATTMVINGDTTRRIYLLQDSTSGMVWVGLPGVNVIK